MSYILPLSPATSKLCRLPATSVINSPWSAAAEFIILSVHSKRRSQILPPKWLAGSAYVYGIFLAVEVHSRRRPVYSDSISDNCSTASTRPPGRVSWTHSLSASDTFSPRFRKSSSSGTPCSSPPAVNSRAYKLPQTAENVSKTIEKTEEVMVHF